MSRPGEILAPEIQPAERRHTAVLFTSSYCMGGIEAHLIDLARGLIQRDWDVALICSNVVDVEPLRQEMSRMGVEVHAVSEAPNLLQLIRRAWRLVRILRLYPKCVVHSHLQGESGGTLILLAAKMASANGVVRTLHNPPVPPISRRNRASVAISDRLLSKVICVSPETRRTQLQEFKWDARKLVTIPNGVDLRRFSPASGRVARQELGLAPDDQLVGTVARLQEERKGISEFIDMAAAVAHRRPRTHFVVVGDGPLRPALERQAALLGLADHVIFTGYRRDVPRFLSAMDVAVFPSSYEAAQYVMLEAMAMAVPVVTTPAGLAIDLIDSGVTGVLVPIHDVGAMSDAVDKLLANPTLARRIGDAGRALIVSGYSAEAMIASIANLYRELTDGHEPPAAGPAPIDFRQSARGRYH